MKIRNRKLQKDAIQTLRRIPVDICKPYEVLMAPVYVYLQKNGKFVAVKLPLQYFSTADLEKLKPYENFYLPDFVDLILPFQKAGESVRSLFEIKQKRPVKTNQGTEMIAVPVPQHELDNAVVHLIASLWNDGAKVEPFFLCFFTNEVCHPFSANVLTEAMEHNTDLFELALIRASTAVFLALHIGYSDPKILAILREKIFTNTMNGITPENSSSEISLLSRLLWEALPSAEIKEISLESIQRLLRVKHVGGKVAQKLLSRLTRIDLEFIQAETEVASLFGEKGICDV